MKKIGIISDCMNAINADNELFSMPVKNADTKRLNPYSKNISEHVFKTVIERVGKL